MRRRRILAVAAGAALLLAACGQAEQPEEAAGPGDVSESIETSPSQELTVRDESKHTPASFEAPPTDTEEPPAQEEDPPAQADPPPEEAAPPEDETPPPADAEPPSRDYEDERVAGAVEDLAGRADADPGQVQVGELKAVTWRDGSIGCPEPGMTYTQALVDGYRLVLEAGGVRYHYHAAGDGDFFYCANPQEAAQDDTL